MLFGNINMLVYFNRDVYNHDTWKQYFVSKSGKFLCRMVTLNKKQNEILSWISTKINVAWYTQRDVLIGW